MQCLLYSCMEGQIITSVHVVCTLESRTKAKVIFKKLRNIFTCIVLTNRQGGGLSVETRVEYILKVCVCVCVW